MKAFLFAVLLCPMFALSSDVDVEEISAGPYSTCYYNGNAILCAGYNMNGQAEDIFGLTRPRSLSHSFHTCFIEEGTVWCHGLNDNGQADPPFLLEPIKVVVGERHSCALDRFGVQCWGDNTFGQVDVPGDLSDVADVRTGGNTTCVLRMSGEINCWGMFSAPEGEGFELLDVGSQNVCGARDNVVYCRGSFSGEFEFEDIRELESGWGLVCVVDGNQVKCEHDGRTQQIQVPTHNSATNLTVGARHACFLDASVPACFGEHTYGETVLNRLPRTPISLSLGSGSTCVLDGTTPDCWGLSYVGYLSKARYLGLEFDTFEIGAPFSCGVKDGALQCFGTNFSGYGDFPEWENVSDFAISIESACGIVNGKVKCWGATLFVNPEEISGPRIIDGSDISMCVATETSVECTGFVPTPENLGRVEQLSIGFSFGCSYGSKGLVCWGDNEYGQLDHPNLINVRKLASEGNHSCALSDEGVSCWGSNSSGQTNVPVLERPYDIAVGSAHSCALDQTGLVCWGDNTFGQSKSKPLARTSVPQSILSIYR